MGEEPLERPAGGSQKSAWQRQPQVVRDTPQTTVAATRFNRIVMKGGKVAGESFREILVDIISESAKKVIWPS